MTKSYFRRTVKLRSDVDLDDPAPFHAADYDTAPYDATKRSKDYGVIAWAMEVWRGGSRIDVLTVNAMFEEDAAEFMQEIARTVYGKRVEFRGAWPYETYAWYEEITAVAA